MEIDRFPWVSGFILALAMSPGCSGDRSAAPDERSPSSPRTSKAAERVDGRDQYRLVREIHDAHTIAEPERRASALSQVRRSWVGRRYRWEVALMPSLCPRPQRCVALPIDHARAERLVPQGWLPRLRLSTSTHAALIERCEGRTRCVFVFEGRLRRLDLNTEVPTSLTFDAITLLGVRDAKPGESWIRRIG